LQYLVTSLSRPVEEYVFYLTGFITILLLYVWLSEYWLAAYTLEDYRGEAQALPKLLEFHPISLVIGVALIAAAIIYKRWFSEVREGWPEYFIVLVVGGLIPSVSFYPVTRRFYQLARTEPDDVFHPADQHALGGDASFALWMVELPAWRDDGRVYRGVVRFAGRGRAGVAGGDLRDGDFV
jgi:hypothetical protein